MPISMEICNVWIVTIDLEPTHSNLNAKTQDKVEIHSYLQCLIFVDKQLEDCCTVSH
jgi:hypothetical protein